MTVEAPRAVASVPAAAGSAVEVEGVSRRYGRLWALIDATFRVPRGTAFMVAGHNGSGKSTLFRVLATALRPDRGRARVAGFDVTDNRDQVRKATALLSHYSYTYDALSALENLQIAARMLGVPDEREAMLAQLDAVGLRERADDVVATFSAGMRKRLALARVAMKRAEVVLLDEPYGSLDVAGFQFVDTLIESTKSRGGTILLSTHQLERGARLCQNGILLRAGRIAWTGPAAQLPDAVHSEEQVQR